MTTSLDTRNELQLDEAAQDLLFREARTANAFTDEPVTDEQLEAIYDLVKWAPTSMNTQPLRVVVLRSDEAKARLLPLLAEGNRAKTDAAPAVALLAADGWPVLGRPARWRLGELTVPWASVAPR